MNTSKSDTVIKKELKVNNMTIKVAKKRISPKTFLEAGIISENDMEMDQRARTAVNMEIKKAKVCKKPIAVYDKKTKKSYLVDFEGKRIEIE